MDESQLFCPLNIRIEKGERRPANEVRSKDRKSRIEGRPCLSLKHLILLCTHPAPFLKTRQLLLHSRRCAQCTQILSPPCSGLLFERSSRHLPHQHPRTSGPLSAQKHFLMLRTSGDWVTGSTRGSCLLVMMCPFARTMNDFCDERD